MAYASVIDVQNRLLGRVLTEGEMTTVGEWLDDVEADILTRYTDILSADAVRLRQLLRVECEVVVSAINNPFGPLRQVSTAIDDYTEARTYAAPRSSGDLLELSDEQWAKLAPAGAVLTAAFTITPSYDA